MANSFCVLSQQEIRDCWRDHDYRTFVGRLGCFVGTVLVATVGPVGPVVTAFTVAASVY